MTPWRANGCELFFGERHGQIGCEAFAAILAEAHNFQVAIAVAEEREACAKVVESLSRIESDRASLPAVSVHWRDIVAVIRARDNPTPAAASAAASKAGPPNRSP